MVSCVYRLDTSALFTSGSAIIGSATISKSITTSAKYFALASGVKAGLAPDLISSILLLAIAINPFRTCFSLSIPLSIMIRILPFAISSDLIKVSSSEIQIEAFAFISAVQSVKVKA